MLFRALIISFCNAIAIASTSQPSPPSRDPWYIAPTNWELSEPGTILRIRVAPGNLTSAVVDNATAAYNILYRSTDSHYQPSWAVTTLFIPRMEYLSPAGRRALLSYQFAYNSADIDASPSYGLYYDLAQPVVSLGLPSDTSLISTLLGYGWYVNIPDYEGPLAAYGALVQSGHATLDAQRAVFSLAEKAWSIDASNISLALWGYSGGSIATEAAAELQVQYASELPVAGVAVGGVVANASADFDHFNGTAVAGNLVSLILGFMAEYPAADTYIRSRLVPEKAADFLETYNRTLSKTTALFAFADIYSYFLNGRDDLYSSPIMQKIYATDSTLGVHGVPDVPLYMYKAIGDTYCPVQETDALVDRYCACNVDITYRRNTIGGHVAEIANGQPGAVEWLWGIFNESFVPLNACSIENVTVNISSAAADGAG